MLFLSSPWAKAADCGSDLGFVSMWGRRRASNMLSLPGQAQKEVGSSGHQLMFRRSLSWVSLLSQSWKGCSRHRYYKVVLNPRVPLLSHRPPPPSQDAFCSEHLQTLDVKLRWSVFLIPKKGKLHG